MLINQLRHVSLHKAAKILWSCSRSEAVSFHFQTLISNTSDSSSCLFHFRCSSSHPFPNGIKLMAIRKICVSAYKYQKTKQDSINRCFTGRQVTCSKDCAVDLKERRKLRELRRQVEAAWAAETCAVGHRVWASFSTKPRKGTSAQKHEKSKFSSRIESYEKLLPINGSFISLSDLNIKYKWQFIISILLQMFFKWSLAKWSHMNGISIRLMVISEQQKTCVCASFCSTNTIDQAKLNKSMLQRPPSHLIKRLCCYRASWGK